jgi:hypothetical protein
VGDRSAVVNVIATFHPLSSYSAQRRPRPSGWGLPRSPGSHEPLATVVLCVAAVVFLLVGLGFTRLRRR